MHRRTLRFTTLDPHRGHSQKTGVPPGTVPPVQNGRTGSLVVNSTEYWSEEYKEHNTLEPKRIRIKEGSDHNTYETAEPLSQRNCRCSPKPRRRHPSTQPNDKIQIAHYIETTKEKPKHVTIPEASCAQIPTKGRRQRQPSRGPAAPTRAKPAHSAHAKRRGAVSPKDQPQPRHRRQTPHRQFAERVSTPPRATLAGPGLWGRVPPIIET